MSNDIYCDSNLFLAWLLNEPGRVNDVQNLFNSANNGSVRIITSALTISEVLHLKGLGQVPKNDRQKVRSLFQNPWVLVIGVNRTIAEESQDLVWGHNIMPKDAIHIATALIHSVPRFYTFDKRLIKLGSVQIPNYGIVAISKP